ncbi:hypothetical protein NM208_g6048 [Fusarium decemcellulare]|uniref:Uncharacterized protein n=1 Tax=Fusarium decemcellulare TaxID=57161 RepID=A0ACC1SEJ4_9HYPO|nr:hypothetical protein NM208_g6048 [Fusarium decemcellulare]
MSGKLFTLAAAVPVVVASFKGGCAKDNWNSTTDYWQHKFDPDDSSAAFVADYHNTYATLRNHAGFTVLHCTDEKPPLSEIGGDKDTLYVKVPVKNVAALDGLSQNLIDMLGKSDSIKRVGKYEDITSACLRGLSYDNKTYDESNWGKAEDVDVIFYGDGQPNNMSRVLLYPHLNSPLGTLSYIKMISMFYGLEEVAEEVYGAIAANYRCAAANVQDHIMKNDYPEGSLLSFVEKDGDNFIVWAGDYWQTLATDAGVRLVNATDSKLFEDYYRGNYWKVSADSEESKVAKESWAIVDTSQYLASSNSRFGTDREEFPARINTQTYPDKSGVDKDIYAFKHKNIFLADKATNRNLKHDLNDRGAARPDYLLLDIISKIKPGLTKDIYTSNFLRSVTEPNEELQQLSDASVCYPFKSPAKSLNLTKCELPKWAAGYHSVGVQTNAFGREETVKSLALTKSSSGLSKGAKAGISVGSIAGGLFVVGAVVTLLIRRKRVAKKSERGSNLEKAKEGRKDSYSVGSV